MQLYGERRLGGPHAGETKGPEAAGREEPVSGKKGLQQHTWEL